MKKSVFFYFRHMAWLSILCLWSLARAATVYQLPADLAGSPFNCVQSGSAYSCPADIDIPKNSTWILDADIVLSIQGEFKIDKDFQMVTQGFQLNVNTTGNFSIKEGFFYGNIDAGGKIKLDKDVFVSGNLQASDKIDIKKDSLVYGNVTAGSELKIDTQSWVYGQCTPSHPRCTGNLLACGTLDSGYALYGGDKIEIKNSPSFNTNQLVPGNYDNGARLDLGASQPVTGQYQSLPGIDPPILPPNPSNTTITLNDGDLITANSAVYYKEIKLEGSNSASLTGGGPFHIGKLKLKDSAVMTLSKGDYFVDELELIKTASLVTNGAPVNIYIGDKFKIKDDGSINTLSVADFRVFMMLGAKEVKFEKNALFKGVVLSPFGVKIEAKDDARIYGRLVTLGKIKIEDRVEIFYTPSDDAIASISTCPERRIDHFNINVGAGNASTCAPFSFSITAEDSSNAAVTDYDGTVSITASSGHGNFAVVSATNSLSPDPDSDDNGSVSYTFDGADNGQIDLSLSNQRAETLRISVTDNAIPLTSTSVDITFRDNAFEIVDVDGAVAGDNVPVAGRDHAYRIRLLRKDPASGQCGLATAYQGNRSLKLWRVRNAADPGGAAPSLAGTALPDNEPASANASIAFTAGEADVTLASSDIGKYTLEAKDVSRSFADIDIAGGSAEQTLRPFGLAIDFSGQRNADMADNGLIDDSTGSDLSYAADAGGSVFTQAGEPFPMTVAGVLWQAADDADNDGLPDNGAWLGDNAVAPSFGAEGESVVAEATVNAPAGASAAALVVDGASGGLFNGFVNGAQTASVQYGNVGIIDIQARLADNDYFGSGVAISGAAPNVGRFNPWQYAVTSSSLTPACSSASPFTYAREPFEVALTLQAQNKSGALTDGYRGAFVTLDIANELNIRNDRTGLPYDQEDYSIIEDFASGTVGEARFTVQLAWDMPLQAPAVSRAELVDSSDEVIRIAGSPYALGQTEVRFGRMVLGNSHGSELLDLPLAMRAEYYDGSNFLINADDSCSGFPVNRLRLDSAVENAQTDGDIQVLPGQVSRATLAHNPLLAGDAGLSLCPPGNPACTPTAGNEGWVDLRLDLGSRPWLRFDWDGDGLYQEDPKARATFGIFRGNDRQIHLRRLFD